MESHCDKQQTLRIPWSETRAPSETIFLNLSPLLQSLRPRAASTAFVLLVLVLLTGFPQPTQGADQENRWQPLTAPGFKPEPFKPVWLGSLWSSLPRGLQRWNDVPFQMQGLLRVTGLAAAKRGDWHPPEVDGIAVQKAFSSLAVLHGLEGDVEHGIPVFALMFHYSDGTQQSVRFSAGVQTASADKPASSIDLADIHSKLVWVGGGKDSHASQAFAFLTQVTNPKPNVVVTHLDFLSLFSEATPVLLGLTLDTAPPSEPSVAMTHVTHLAKKATKIPEADLRRPLVVHAVDAITHQPITNAEFFLSIGTEDHLTFLDRRSADATGSALLHYPPTETVDRVVFARAPGWIASTRQQSRSTQSKLDDTLTLELKKGQPIGGIVKDASGNPVTNAQVILTSTVVGKKRDVTRADFDLVVTGNDGRWSSTSAPEDLKGTQFQIKHPDFEFAYFKLSTDVVLPQQATNKISSTKTSTNRVQRSTTLNPDVAAPAKKATAERAITPSMGKAKPVVNRTLLWKPEDLKTGEAVAMLKVSERLVGTVMNSRKEPVAGAYVGPLMDEMSDNAIPLTDKQGRFELSQDHMRSPGKLYVLSDHYAPLAFDWDPGSRESETPLHLVLQPPNTMIGLIADQTGAPVPGVQVRLLSWNDSTRVNWSGTTDHQGHFYWSNAAPGQLGFQLSATNFQRNDYQIDWSGAGELQMRMQRQSMVFGLVKDADTGKPIPDFIAIRGYAYNPLEAFRWQRGNSIKGRNGAFSGVVYNYGTGSRQVIMIEAPGYQPTLTEEMKSGTWSTNEVVLKRGRGYHGVVQAPDGTPARNVPLVMVEGDEWVFIEKNAQITRNSSYTEQLRADAQGHFEFQPHLRTARIVAANATGIADVSGEEVERSGVITLQPWSRVEGTYQVSSTLQSNQIIKLETFRKSYVTAGSNRTSAVWVNAKTLPDKDGRFVFEQVPPGTRMVFVETRLAERRNSSRSGQSHEVIVDLKPSATQSVTLGGGGRRIVGKMRILGGDPDDVDWLWDVHSLQANPPQPKGYPTMTFTGNETQIEQQQRQQQYQASMEAFMATPEGDRYERGRRRFMLQFDTNGVFSVDNVPPGEYSLNIAPMEKPADTDSYSYRQLGRVDKQVSVKADAKANAIQDLGTLDITIRGAMRVGKKAPPFEIKTMEGHNFTSKELSGKVVLLYFWMNWESSSYDMSVIKELIATYEQSHQLVVILPTAMNAAALRTIQKANPLPAPIGALEDWNSDPLIMAFNIQSWPNSVLIDTEGRIASFGMRGSSIRPSVTRAMTKIATASAAPNP